MIVPERGHRLGANAFNGYAWWMLNVGLFPDFKGADTLLFWGDALGVAELRASIAELSRGLTSTITISDVSISVGEHAPQSSELSRTSNGLAWVCAPNVLGRVEELLAGLDGAASGHQFIESTGLADQVIVAKNEYPETLPA
jgi:hypothetical protein